MNRKKTILDVLYRKQVFLEYENIGLKKTPNLHVSKNDSGQKAEVLSSFLFIKNRSRKSVW